MNALMDRVIAGMRFAAVCATAALASVTVRAQWVTPSMHGAKPSGTITLPLEAVIPLSAPVRIRPSPFILERADGARLGPFAFQNGTRVRIGDWVFELRVVEGMSFELTAGGSARPWGPFPLEEDAVVRVGAEEYRIRRAPSLITGLVHLENVASPRVTVALIRWDDELPNRLGGVRVEIQRIGADLAYYAAPRRDDAPVVRSTRGSVALNPDITRSQADLDRAFAQAERKAKNAVETLLRESRATTTTCEAQRGRFSFTNLPAGRYLVCLIAEARVPESGRVPKFETRYWWADAILDERDLAEVEFTDAGRTWRNMFP